MTGEAATSNRPGMTLVELLIVMVVVGVLAAMMIYRTSEATRQANLAVVMSDLRSMTVAQEIHHQRAMEYGELAELSGFRPSNGVTIDLGWRDRTGYAATATHSALPDTECGVFRGPAPADAAGPAEVEDEIACQ